MRGLANVRYHNNVQRIKVLVHIFNKLTSNTVLYPVVTSQIYLHDNYLLLNIYTSLSEE